MLLNSILAKVASHCRLTGLKIASRVDFCSVGRSNTYNLLDKIERLSRMRLFSPKVIIIH